MSTSWLTEAEVDARLDDMRARVLGGLLDRAAHTLAALADTTPVRDLRMADFATFLAAYDTANGTDALGAYRRQVDEAFAEALASDPLAVAVIEFMDGRNEWAGTAAELLRALDPHRPSDDREFWPRRTRSGASLRRVGIEWHRPTGPRAGKDRRRIAHLTRITQPTKATAATAATADSLFVVFEGQKRERRRGEALAQQGGNQRSTPQSAVTPPAEESPW